MKFLGKITQIPLLEMQATTQNTRIEKIEGKTKGIPATNMNMKAIKKA